MALPKIPKPTRLLLALLLAVTTSVALAQERARRVPGAASQTEQQASEPRGKGTVVCRTPVRTPIPSGGAEAAVSGSWAAGPARMGGGWPAAAYVSVPEAGSWTPTTTVVKSPPDPAADARPAASSAARGDIPASR